MSEVLAVEAIGMSKSFGSLRALDDISLRVARGEVYGVLGPGGAGKTTLLRMLLGLARADAGSIRIFGRTWEDAGAGVLDGVAGFIERPRFYPYLTGRENLEGLAVLVGGSAARRVEEVLDLVALEDGADRKVGGYSCGLRQRLGVAASLLREPRLLVLDDPADGLDHAGLRDLQVLVKRLADGGLTVLLGSPALDEVGEICDNVTFLERGALALPGTVSVLRARASDAGHRLRSTDGERPRPLAVAG